MWFVHTPTNGNHYDGSDDYTRPPTFPSAATRWAQSKKPARKQNSKWNLGYRRLSSRAYDDQLSFELGKECISRGIGYPHSTFSQRTYFWGSDGMQSQPHACLAAAAFKHRHQNQKMAAADGINNRNSIMSKCWDSSVTLTSSFLTMTIEESLQENQLQTYRQRGRWKVGIKNRIRCPRADVAKHPQLPYTLPNQSTTKRSDNTVNILWHQPKHLVKTTCTAIMC